MPSKVWICLLLGCLVHGLLLVRVLRFNGFSISQFATLKESVSRKLKMMNATEQQHENNISRESPHGAPINHVYHGITPEKERTDMNSQFHTIPSNSSHPGTDTHASNYVSLKVS